MDSLAIATNATISADVVFAAKMAAGSLGFVLIILKCGSHESIDGISQIFLNKLMGQAKT